VDRAFSFLRPSDFRGLFSFNLHPECSAKKKVYKETVMEKPFVTELIILSLPWQRALGAMFRGALKDRALVFDYPYTAARHFHTFFCAPLRILALDTQYKIIHDEVIAPWRFVRLPVCRVVIEADPEVRMSVSSIQELLKRVLVDQPHQQTASGAWAENISLHGLLFALLSQAVADIRRVKDVHEHFENDVDPELLKTKFDLWERGQILDAAGCILDFADTVSIPPTAVKLARKLLHIEGGYAEELLVASVGGIPWKHEFDNYCLRCGKSGSWRPVLSPSPDTPHEMTWRYQRPENAVPLCFKCVDGLKWNHRHDLKLDLCWGLWAARFEALWKWHMAVEDHSLSDWNKAEYPLWPSQYGGHTWALGSGAWEHADPYPPDGIVRNRIHQTALARGLGPRWRRRRGYFEDTPIADLVSLDAIDETGFQEDRAWFLESRICSL